MSLFNLRIFLSILFTASQLVHTVHVKEKPEFGPEIQNRQLQIITKEYFKLSARYNVKFDKNVTIGFSTITRENVIGTCSYRPEFREIDLDSEYWKTAKWATKVALVFHEMTHCYCGRPHDFDEGEMYPDGSLAFIIQRILLKQPFTPLRPKGFLEDNCPQSIMYPVVLSNVCFKKHYSHYVEEMFSRCKAW